MASSTKYFSNEPQPNLNADEPSSTTALTLAYRTVGTPDLPAVLMPSCYGGKLDDTLPFLYTSVDNRGAPAVLANHFVIVVGMLSGSESSSPSNAHVSMGGLNFPKVTIEDNVRLQHALCRALGVEKLAAYIGFSMGGIQAYHMGVIYPDFVERIVILAGAARASWHNISFLEGPKAALVNSEDFHGGRYVEPARMGTQAFGRVYSTWALSSAWFREKNWEKLGFNSMWEYLEEEWERSLGSWDAHDLLGMLQMWQSADVSIHGPVKGDFVAALGSIQAKALVMPSRTDSYFPPEDSMEEVKHLKQGKLKIIESVWGHLAGGGAGTREDTEFIKDAVEGFLAE